MAALGIGALAGQDRPDVAARRKPGRAAQPFIDPESLVFLDETGVNTRMTRLYGWAPVGERWRYSAPFGHWKTMMFIAGPQARRHRGAGQLSAHKVAGIREAIAERRARIFYLPPYSPDMNPIAMAFSKLKAPLHILRLSSSGLNRQPTKWTDRRAGLSGIAARKA